MIHSSLTGWLTVTHTLIAQLQNEHVQALNDRAAAAEINRDLKAQIATFSVPPIVDYVRQKQR